MNFLQLIPSFRLPGVLSQFPGLPIVFFGPGTARIPTLRLQSRSQMQSELHLSLEVLGYWASVFASYSPQSQGSFYWHMNAKKTGFQWLDFFCRQVAEGIGTMMSSPSWQSPNGWPQDRRWAKRCQKNHPISVKKNSFGFPPWSLGESREIIGSQTFIYIYIYIIFVAASGC